MPNPTHRPYTMTRHHYQANHADRFWGLLAYKKADELEAGLKTCTDEVKQQLFSSWDLVSFKIDRPTFTTKSIYGDNYWITPVQYKLLCSDFASLQVLLDAGADINAPADQENNILHFAFGFCNPAVIKEYLPLAEASLDRHNTDGLYPLDFLILRSSGATPTEQAEINQIYSEVLPVFIKEEKDIWLNTTAVLPDHFYKTLENSPFYQHQYMAIWQHYISEGRLSKRNKKADYQKRFEKIRDLIFHNKLYLNPKYKKSIHKILSNIANFQAEKSSVVSDEYLESLNLSYDECCSLDYGKAWLVYYKQQQKSQAESFDLNQKHNVLSLAMTASLHPEIEKVRKISDQEIFLLPSPGKHRIAAADIFALNLWNKIYSCSKELSPQQKEHYLNFLTELYLRCDSLMAGFALGYGYLYKLLPKSVFGNSAATVLKALISQNSNFTPVVYLIAIAIYDDWIAPHITFESIKDKELSLTVEKRADLLVYVIKNIDSTILSQNTKDSFKENCYKFLKILENCPKLDDPAYVTKLLAELKEWTSQQEQPSTQQVGDEKNTTQQTVAEPVTTLALAPTSIYPLLENIYHPEEFTNHFLISDSSFFAKDTSEVVDDQPLPEKQSASTDMVSAVLIEQVNELNIKVATLTSQVESMSKALEKNQQLETARHRAKVFKRQGALDFFNTRSKQFNDVTEERSTNTQEEKATHTIELPSSNR